jgi:hypothetical protein
MERGPFPVRGGPGSSSRATFDCNLFSFSAVKTYFLGGKLMPEMRRMRSVPRFIQDKLGTDLFGQDVTKNATNVRSTSMRPTKGLQVAILQESKRIAHSMNFKQKCLVSRPQEPKSVFFSHYLSLQNSVNSVALK